jgi:hypothetical protein
MERAASAPTLENAYKLFPTEGYPGASSKLSLMVPDPGRQMAFARLSEYAEMTLKCPRSIKFSCAVPVGGQTSL